VKTAARVLLLTLGAWSASFIARAQTKAPPDLGSATIEDLMNVLVTTASRGPEGIGSAPARVQVVTAAQIERRGYRSLLDVLKDLPDFKVDLFGDPDYANATLMLSGQFLYDHQPDLSRFYPSDFHGMEAQRTGVFNTIFGPMTSSRPSS
jgi:outer membrane receptor protein involved in Fe transport